MRRPRPTQDEPRREEQERVVRGPVPALGAGLARRTFRPIRARRGCCGNCRLLDC